MNKLYILLFLLFSFSAYSQQPTNKLADLGKASGEPLWNSLYQITKEKINHKSDSITFYMEKLQRVADELSDCGRCQAGTAFLAFHSKRFNRDDMRSLIELGEQALTLAQEHQAKDFEVILLNELGFLYREIGSTAKATTYLFKSLEYSRAINNKQQEGNALRYLSNLFLLQHDYEKGLEYALEAQKIYASIKYVGGERAILFELHDLYIEVENYEKGLEYLLMNFDEKYAPFMTALDSANVYNNIGRLYQRDNQSKKAITYLEKALKMRTKADDTVTGRLYTLNELMTVYKNMEDYSKALEYVKVIEPQLDSVQDIYLKRNIQMHFSDIFAAVGQYEKAYAAEYAFGEYRDSINRIKEKEVVLGLEAKYENQMKEDKITLLNKDKKIANGQRNLLILSLILLAILGVVGFRWLTFKKEREKQLLQAEASQLKALDELKSTFFINITHELRTPLTLILSPLNALMQGKYGQLPTAAADILTVVQRNSQQLMLLINEILDLSKLAANQLVLNEQSVELKPFISRLFGAFDSLAIFKGIDYQMAYFAQEDLIIQLDKKKFEKIINNLLSNALKFTSKGGNVWLHIDESDTKIIIKVKDTGRGIHPNDLPNIFNRFYQSNQTNLPKEGGTGIGLALAKEYANLFEGQLTAVSNYGKSTVFTLTLPKKISTEQPVSISTQKESTNEMVTTISSVLTNSEKSKLLIVEDNRDMQQFIKSLLVADYQVTVANNGKEALEILKNERPDVIISDVMMPELDGFELLKQLKSNQQTANIPVIMLTARAAEVDKLRALRIGVDDYMTKPFSHEELQVRVKNMVNNYKNRSTDALPKTSKKTATKAKLPIKDNPNHQKWLQQVEQILLRELTNRHYTLLSLTHELHISQSQLSRRIKAITGLTPNKYLLEIRLHKAKRHLEDHDFETVAEVSYAIGFEDPQYFSKVYFKRYGKRPSDYLKM